MKKLSKRNGSITPSPIRKMFNLVGSKANTINLVLGEPDFPTPRHIIDFSYRALCEGNTHYTHNSGMELLRKTIAQKLNRETGLDYQFDSQIIVTAGAQEALFLTFQTLLEKGDEVILSNPYYPPYANEIALGGGTPVFVDVHERDGFVFTLASLEKAITKHTKAILVNSPANPTGGMIAPEVLQGIAELAVRYDLYVVTDEVYKAFRYDGEAYVSIASFPGMKERTIILDSLSKSYAMTGWRVGFAACNDDIYAHMMHMQENVMSCVSTAAQFAAVEAYAGPQQALHDMIGEYGKRRRLIVDGLNSIPHISCIEPKGAFYAFANMSETGMSSEEFAMSLFDDTGVLLVPGSGFGSAGEGYIRISFATSQKIIQEGLNRINSFIAKKCH
ncbi:pyridoxal phosphate-dependent aminotransferase [Sediminispirochaeta bajacaliforniensis]|uniref:pyridoxal phosphate-dependent aminotransferase n=1 Tax=Sediminispirochaeta bajacaliforniensis TaxID=148 RepID=UPI00047654AF|nr:pyridoxal phosphate-dependent aminotransferase [Sediminispirochaeta bajacaliforniensis]